MLKTSVLYSVRTLANLLALIRIPVVSPRVATESIPAPQMPTLLAVTMVKAALLAVLLTFAAEGAASSNANPTDPAHPSEVLVISVALAVKLAPVQVASGVTFAPNNRKYQVVTGVPAWNSVLSMCVMPSVVSRLVSLLSSWPLTS